LFLVANALLILPGPAQCGKRGVKKFLPFTKDRLHDNARARAMKRLRVNGPRIQDKAQVRLPVKSRKLCTLLSEAFFGPDFKKADFVSILAKVYHSALETQEKERRWSRSNPDSFIEWFVDEFKSQVS
jgi:hypothetical protein